MMTGRVFYFIAMLFFALWYIDVKGEKAIVSAQEGVYLVNGVVVNTASASDQLSTVTIQIDGIYCGPTNLIGRSFADHASAELPPGKGHYIVPIPRKSTEGIWAIKTNGAEIIVWRGYADKLWPSLPTSDSRYEEAKQLAQAVHAVESVEGKEEKTKLLTGYAFSRIPEISRWATRTLFDSKGEYMNAVLDAGIPKTSLPVLGKLVADELLAVRCGQSWTLSQDRYTMLLALADSPMDSLESEKFTDRLQAIAQTKCEEVPDDILVSIVERTTGNKELSPKCRTSSLYALQYPLRKSGNEKAVQLLIDKVEKETPEMARLAAVILRYNANPNEEQRAQLRKMKDKTTDTRRVKDIDDIFAAWNTRSKPKP